MTVKIVPPDPTFRFFPTFKRPIVLSNAKFDDVEKSLLVLNSISPSFPGEKTLIVTPIPGDPSGFKYPSILTADPTKLSCVILLTPPGGVMYPSLYTEIDPGINPPPTGTQYLSPGNPRTLIF